MEDRYTLVTTREIDAPVERVWAAWHDPDRIARWWGPDGFRSTVQELDVREGGRFRVVMHGPDGTDYANTYVFGPVEEHKRIVFTHLGSEEYGLAPFTSTFAMESAGPTTRVVLTARFATEDEKRKHVEDFQAARGSEELLRRLEEQAR